MENYLNILFIRLRPSGRYIFRRASFRGRGTRESGKEAENERETMKENGRKRMRQREKERVRGRGSESSEKGCNKKEGGGGDRAVGVSAWNL